MRKPMTKEDSIEIYGISDPKTRDTVVDAGRTQGLVKCDITDPDGKFVAHLEGVNKTPRDDQAAGR